jgi:predicted N-acyltransferase
MYLEPKLREVAPAGVDVRYIGRPERASPAEGYPAAHVGEQSRIIREALDARGRPEQVHLPTDNRGYRDFDHYLESFTAEKRKKARRERRRVVEDGVTFETLLGNELDRGAIDEVYDLHRDTFLRHGHEPYLTRELFRAMPGALGENFMVKRASCEGETAAAAVFFFCREALYGRYWGARAQHHSLHFEACYHQGIEFCIERGIGRFEPGTQGEHKVSRGFVPANTWSMHWIVDPRFRAAIGDYLRREGAHMDEYARDIDAHVPYRDSRRIARSKP